MSGGRDGSPVGAIEHKSGADVEQHDGVPGAEIVLGSASPIGGRGDGGWVGKARCVPCGGCGRGGGGSFFSGGIIF
jgi:hypothetical protein